MTTPSTIFEQPSPEETVAPVRVRGRRPLALALSTWPGRLGLAGVLLVLGVATVGPLLAGSPTRPITAPFTPPGHGQALGTDLLGRSVLDRVLHGGLRLILVATVATGLAYVIGASLGLFAGYKRKLADAAIMRALDVLLSFPPILLLLLLAASAGQGLPTIFIGSVFVNIPGAARIIRSATQETVGQPFVEAAILRGERTAAILRREILPNILGSLFADAGPRLSGTIVLVAGLNYLGIGINPPTPDWGAMIFENRDGLTIQPWAVAVPAILIVLLVVSINLLGDAYARSIGRSGVVEAPPA